MTPDPLSQPDTPASQGRRKPARRVGLSRLDLAALLGLSASTIDRMNAAGQLPTPLRLGGTLRWNVREVLAWLDSGSPDRKTWAPIWAASVRARRVGRGR